MNKFDNYLKVTDKKQKIMILVSFILCLGFVLNQFVPPMLEKQNELLENINRLENELGKNNTNKLKKQLLTRKKDLLILTEKLNSKKDEINYVMSNIYKIKYASFSDLKWANTLDDMLRFSVKKNIKIISLKNSDTKDISSSIVKHKRDIKINGIGRYSDILSFVQYIESFNTLLEFKNIDLSLVKDGVEFNIELAAYGVGL